MQQFASVITRNYQGEEYGGEVRDNVDVIVTCTMTINNYPRHCR